MKSKLLLTEVINNVTHQKIQAKQYFPIEIIDENNKISMALFTKIKFQ